MTQQEWFEYYRYVKAIADRVNQMRHDRGFALAATVGLPRNSMIIHNAAIDRNCTGWSAAGPHVHKTARAALRLINDWSASRLCERITNRAWQSISR